MTLPAELSQILDRWCPIRRPAFKDLPPTEQARISRLYLQNAVRDADPRAAFWMRPQ